mmetsp:Transcript_23999/g.60387  ORF Transcript_23999/g.60387 Transcript_23999/m.60387 type:complete len:265 (+) Transcript_23999:2050-2844(+)
MSPHRRRANSRQSITAPVTSAYSCAKDSSVNDQPLLAAEKATLPTTGSISLAPPPGVAALISPLTSSIVCRSLWYASTGGSLSSVMRRSTLLIMRQMGSCSCTACLMARSVTHMTPSTASTTSSTPSASRIAAVTSSLKLTWPGQSSMLNRRLFPLDASITSVIGVILMLMPRCCSSIRVSVQRSSRSFERHSWRTSCVCLVSMSIIMVLPWCRWPTTATTEPRCGVDMRPAIKSSPACIDSDSRSSTSNFFTRMGAMMGCSSG